MDIKVREVSGNEEKSVQEVEQELLDKHEEKHNEVVSENETSEQIELETEQKEVVSEKIEKFYIRLSQNLSGKLREQIDDKRNNKETLFTVEYDPTKSPAEQYKVKYHSQPE